MFSCKKCNSDLKDTDRYCYGCGAYIGEPAVKFDEWQEAYDNEEEQKQYEYSEEGKIIELHCEECDAIVEKYYKYCSNCGKSLENNTRIELVEPKTLDESSAALEVEGTGLIEKSSTKIVSFIKNFFSNKKLVAAAALILVAVIGGNYIYKQFNKPVPRYEQDLGYKSFVQDKSFIYYSYFMNTQINGLQEKRGMYKIKPDGSNMSKISDSPAVYMNLYKDYIYYINSDESRIYRMKKDGSDNKKISDDKALSLIVDKGYVYYRDAGAEQNASSLYRMKMDGTKKKEICKDALTYNILGNYIYYSSRSSLGDVYRIKTDGSGKAKVCEIDGALKYIKDDYVYYTMVDKGTKDPTQFMHDIGYISKVKLNGIKPTELSEEQVYNFVLDDNNIYYEKTDVEKGDDSNALYRLNSEGKDKTKVADNIFIPTYVANDQVYYIEHNSYLPYRKDFKSSKEISLLGIDEKLAETYKIEVLKRQTRAAEEVEKNIVNGMNRVGIIKRKGDNQIIEVDNMKSLVDFFKGVQEQKKKSLEVAYFTQDGLKTSLREYIELQYDGKKIAYSIYKKDGKAYKVDKVLLFEDVVVKDRKRYLLIEKKGDSEEKGLEIFNEKF